MTLTLCSRSRRLKYLKFLLKLLYRLNVLLYFSRTCKDKYIFRTVQSVDFDLMTLIPLSRLIANLQTINFPYVTYFLNQWLGIYQTCIDVSLYNRFKTCLLFNIKYILNILNQWMDFQEICMKISVIQAQELFAF